MFRNGDKMNIRVIGAVFAGLLLTGCALPSWDGIKSTVGLGDDSAQPMQPGDVPVSEPAPAPVASQPAPVVSQPAPAVSQGPAPVAPQATAAPAPMAQEPRADSWCQQVANASATDAKENGFDRETQQRRAANSYRQCLSEGVQSH